MSPMYIGSPTSSVGPRTEAPTLCLPASDGFLMPALFWITMVTVSPAMRPLEPSQASVALVHMSGTETRMSMSSLSLVK